MDTLTLIAPNDPFAWVAFALVTLTGISVLVFVCRSRSTGKYSEQLTTLRAQVTTLRHQHERDQLAIRASLDRELAAARTNVHLVAELAEARKALENHKRESA